MKNKPPHAAAPVIETPRLRLRGYEPKDFSAFCALWNDPAVYRYITNKPLSEEVHWSRLLKLAGHWQFVSFGSWAVIEKANGNLVGQCGFGDNHREMPAAMPEPEMGWVLRGTAQDQGLGFEATSAALAWFEQQFEYAQTACIIDPANKPSQKLAAKLGYKLATETIYKNKPTLLFHRPRSSTS